MPKAMAHIPLILGIEAIVLCTLEVQESISAVLKQLQTHKNHGAVERIRGVAPEEPIAECKHIRTGGLLTTMPSKGISAVLHVHH